MNNNELTGELLNFLGEKLNIDLNDVLQKNEDMRKKQILETHKAEHKVWQSNGKRVRWYTYIPDNNSPKKNKTKLLVRTTEEDLEEAIIDYYISTDKERNSMTIEKLYKEWFQYKEKHTNSTTYMHRIDNDWQKYYKGTYIIKKPIVDLDFLTVENWALDIIRKNDMPRKTYSNMTIIIRQILDYAVNKSIIDNNVFSKIKIPSKLFKPTKRKNDETQVFMVDEKPLIVKSAYDDYEDSDEAVCLGVAFLFETGLRIGEMLALEFSDIYVDKPYISITKSEIKCEEKKPNGKWVITGYEVVPHAKTKAGERDVYLTEKAREILNTVRIWNKENGFSDNGYIFNMKDGQKAHTKDVQNRLYKYCRHNGITKKSLHKIRKTYISTLIDSGDISISTITKIVGHKSPRTTYDSYVFSRKSDTQVEKDIENALK